MIVNLPYPDKELSPNARLHWSKVAKAKAAYRKVCVAFTREAMGRETFTAPVSVYITIYPPDKRRRDDDNAIGSFKAGRDGVADAIKVDDADWDTTYRVMKKPLGQVIVEVSEPFEVPSI